MELAPIVLFVYNRPEHTRACLEYLERNELAAESELYVFADGAKSGSEEAVAAVRQGLLGLNTAQAQGRTVEIQTVECRGATGEQGAGSQCDCGGNFGVGDARPGDRLGRRFDRFSLFSAFYERGTGSL